MMSNFRDLVYRKGYTMYNLYDKEGAIKAVQRLLMKNQTGVIDQSTREEIKKIQKEVGLIDNGIVDYRTFIEIVNLHRKESNIRLSGKSDGISNFPYYSGSMGRDMSIINSYISAVLAKYNYSKRLPTNNYFSVDTESAVLWLRKIFGLSNKNIIDEEFYIRLKREILTL